MSGLVLWTEIGANIATMVAAMVAIVTIPLAYYQIRGGEKSRRLDIVEGRIVDAFLQLPIEPINISSFIGPEYRELIRDLSSRYRTARLLRNWRMLAGVGAHEPLLSEAWHKLTFDVITVENECRAILDRENIDLEMYKDQSLDAIYQQSADGSGGFSNLPTLIEGGREVLRLCDMVRRGLRAFDSETFDVMTRTLSGTSLRQ
jgi:hypothetical protein